MQATIDCVIKYYYGASVVLRIGWNFCFFLCYTVVFFLICMGGRRFVGIYNEDYF